MEEARRILCFVRKALPREKRDGVAPLTDGLHLREPGGEQDFGLARGGERCVEVARLAVVGYAKFHSEQAVRSSVVSVNDWLN